MDPRSGGAALAGVAAPAPDPVWLQSENCLCYLCNCNFTELKQFFFDFLQIQRPWTTVQKAEVDGAQIKTIAVTVPV